MNTEEGLERSLFSLREKEGILLKELNVVQNAIYQTVDELHNIKINKCESLNKLLRFMRENADMTNLAARTVQTQFDSIVKGLFPKCWAEINFVPWGTQVKIRLTGELSFDSEVLTYFLKEVGGLSDILLVSAVETYAVYPLENNRFCLEMYTQFTPDMEFDSLTELLEFVYENEDDQRR